MKLVKTFLFGSAVVAGIVAFGGKADAAEIEHVVTSSDSLWGLSVKYFGSEAYIDKIAEDNDIVNKDLIYDGEVLLINTDDKSTASVKTTEADTEASSETNQEPAAQTATQETVTDTAGDQNSYAGTTMYMEATAYSSDPADALGGGSYTATGQNLLENPMAVAVDPSVIPLGTHLYVEGYGEAYAVDTGGAIQGNIIDVHFPTYAQCEAWGRRQVKVTILD